MKITPKSPLGCRFWRGLVLSTSPCHTWCLSLLWRSEMKLKILALLSVITMVPALYMIFLFAPMETTQRNAQRIFYIHVPLAIIGAYGSAVLLFVWCRPFLITKNIGWDRFSAVSGESGVVVTAAQLW